jgi:hypothetical protein
MLLASSFVKVFTLIRSTLRLLLPMPPMPDMTLGLPPNAALLLLPPILLLLMPVLARGLLAAPLKGTPDAEGLAASGSPWPILRIYSAKSSDCSFLVKP